MDKRNEDGARPPKEPEEPPEPPAAPATEESVAARPRGVALAAKDSEWIGMRSDFASADAGGALPLFPGVKFTDHTESTTVITKLLVGKTADFSTLARPKRMYIKKYLSTVREQATEEAQPSDSDVSSILRQADANHSGSDVENYDDEDDEPRRATHTKRRKRRSDLHQLPDDKSSVSLIPTVRRKSGSRMRHADDAARPPTSVFERSSWTMSNDADDEYQSPSDDAIVAAKIAKRE